MSLRAILGCGLIFASVWFVATFFLLGDLGWWNDDYFVSQLNPVTGEVLGNVLPSRSPFQPPGEGLWLWRPLLTVGTVFLLTSTWHAPWIAHLVIALLHGCVGLALFALLRRVGRRWQSSLAAACFYVCWPAHFEVAFWPNGYMVGVGFLFFLLCALQYACWVQTGGRWQVWTCIVCGCMVPLCHEIPTCVLVLAMPWVYLMARPTMERPHTRRWAWTMPLAGITVFLGAYAVARVAMSVGSDDLTMSARGLTIAEWRPLVLLRSIGESLVLLRQGWGRVGLGWETLLAHPARALACVGVLLAGVVLVASPWRRWAGPDSPAGARLHSAQRSRTALLALLVFVGTLIPLGGIAMNDARPRFMAGVVLALAIGLACLMDAILNRRAPAVRGRWATAWGLSGCVMIAIGCLGMLGAQRTQQIRAGLDQVIIASLREQIPDPPRNAFFVVADCFDRPTHGGETNWDHHFFGPLSESFAAPVMGRHIWGREDVEFMNWPVWRGCDDKAVVLRGTLRWSARGVVVDDRLKGFRVPWDRLFPLEVLEDGSVRLVTHIRFTQWGEPRGIYPVPALEPLVYSGAIPIYERLFLLEPPQEPPSLTPQYP